MRTKVKVRGEENKKLCSSFPLKLVSLIFLCVIEYKNDCGDIIAYSFWKYFYE